MITVDARAPEWVHIMVRQINQALQAGMFNDVSVSGTLTLSGGTLLKTNAALTNGSAAQTATLTNGPTAGNPTKWVPITDLSTTRYLPLW